MKAAKAISGYLFNQLLPEVTSPEAPKMHNLGIGFRDYICDQGIPISEAEDKAENWKPQLLERLEIHLREWELCGVPRPASTSLDQDDLLLTWRHSKYCELTGVQNLPEGYFDIYDWLVGLTEAEFLFPSVCLLKIMGAENIFVTDGPGDEGIDCIARLGHGALHSVVIFLQSKTFRSNEKLASRDLVLSEYGKYLSMPHSSIYDEYRRALGIDSSVDGAAYCYLFVTNSYFHKSSQDVSAKIGILLRSVNQMAYWLSLVGSIEKYREKHDELKGRMRKDLSHDLSKDLEFLTKST